MGVIIIILGVLREEEMGTTTLWKRSLEEGFGVFDGDKAVDGIYVAVAGYISMFDQLITTLVIYNLLWGFSLIIITSMPELINILGHLFPSIFNSFHF